MIVPPAEKTFTHPIVAFVEGRDEVNVVQSILAAMGRNDIELCHVGGKDKLQHNFPAAVKQSSFVANVRSVAVIQDADADHAEAFRRVTALLGKHGFPVPKNPDEIVSDAKYRVGVFIVPGGTRNGYLEDLFLDSQAGHDYLACVDAFSTCCAAAGRAAFDSKERAYSMLVSLGAPENRLGRAFESGVLSGAHTAYDRIRGFLGKF